MSGANVPTAEMPEWGWHVTRRDQLDKIYWSGLSCNRRNDYFNTHDWPHRQEYHGVVPVCVSTREPWGIYQYEHKWGVLSEHDLVALHVDLRGLKLMVDTPSLHDMDHDSLDEGVLLRSALHRSGPEDELALARLLPHARNNINDDDYLFPTLCVKEGDLLLDWETMREPQVITSMIDYMGTAAVCEWISPRRLRTVSVMEARGDTAAAFAKYRDAYRQQDAA